MIYLSMLRYALMLPSRVRAYPHSDQLLHEVSESNASINKGPKYENYVLKNKRLKV